MLEQLRADAQRANALDWYDPGSLTSAFTAEYDFACAERDVPFIHQATPEAVLALLDVAEAAEGAIAYEGDDGITYCGTCGFVEDICRCGVPMARLRQTVARLREVASDA